MEKSKAATKERSPDGLSLPNQNTISINIIWYYFTIYGKYNGVQLTKNKKDLNNRKKTKIIDPLLLFQTLMVNISDMSFIFKIIRILIYKFHYNQSNFHNRQRTKIWLNKFSCFSILFRYYFSFNFIP